MGVAPIDIELVERFTGQRRVTDVHRGLEELRAAEVPFRRADRNHRVMTRRRARAASAVRVMRLRVAVARLPGKVGAEPWALALVACIILGLGGGLCCLFLVAAPPWVLVSVTVLPFLVLMPALPLLFPPVAKLDGVNDRVVRALELSLKDESVTAQALVHVRGRYLAAKRLYDGLLRAAEAPLARLLNADFRKMSGDEFELYLVEVFRFLGYVVQPTGQSGDQGADLVVELNGVRTAIQAKCYSGTVGNAAVQEAYAGRAFYGCQKCAVITSSTFTRAAVAAAQATGCVLIDGAQIQSLVRGRVVL